MKISNQSAPFYAYSGAKRNGFTQRETASRKEKRFHAKRNGFTQRETASRKEKRLHAKSARERGATAGTGARTALSCPRSPSFCSCSLWSELRSILGALSAPASSPSRARRAASLASSAVATWQSGQWPPQSGQPVQFHLQ
eukprot:COSAG06_NODE_1256_length_10087_cov_7.646676_7_plen_141_part_00